MLDRQTGFKSRSGLSPTVIKKSVSSIIPPIPAVVVESTTSTIVRMVLGVDKSNRIHDVGAGAVR